MTADAVYGTTDTAVFALDRRTGRRRWAHRLDEPDRAVRLHRTARGARPRLRLDDRLRAGRSGRAVRPRPAHGQGPLALRDRSRPVEVPVGRRWRRVVSRPRSRRTARSTSASRTPARGAGRGYAPTAACTQVRCPTRTRCVALSSSTGKLRWYDQVTKHDVRDYDFEASPIVVGPRVFGAGKAGRVVAWNRHSGRR